MTPPDALDGVRARIDALDRDLVALIAARERLVLEAGRLKRSADAVRAPARVEQVIERVRSLAEQTGASPVVVERTYRAMIAAFVDRELVATGLGASTQPPAPHEDAEDDVVIESLATGHRSEGNLALYARHGYVEQRREELRPGVVLVHLAKPLRGPAEPAHPSKPALAVRVPGATSV